MPESFGQIGIVGVGVVGGALRAYLETRGVEPHLYDPALGLGSIDSVHESDLVFVCVPTPYRPGTGFDVSLVEEAVSGLGGSKTVVVKSTVVPGTTDRLQAAYPQHRFLFNPEFLREATAAQDFLEPDRQIVGFSRKWDVPTAEAVLDLLPPAPFAAVMPARAAELVKSATNSFLAVKVIFANEIFDLCAALGIDYEDVRLGLAADARIGPSHMDVMDSGYRGYGGKCLPKDSMSLLDFARQMEVSLRVIEAAHEVNLGLRGESVADDLVRGGAARPGAIAA